MNLIANNEPFYQGSPVKENLIKNKGKAQSSNGYNDNMPK
jgi:hypothetical protein